MDVLLSQLLVGITETTKNDEYNQIFKQTNFVQKLNNKAFEQITYVLLKTIDEKLVCNLPWPVVLQKERDGFLRHIYGAFEELKKQYPNVKLNLLQKSHFANPRIENQKLIEFLVQLSTLTVYVLTGNVDNKRNKSEIVEETKRLEDECEVLEENIRKMKIELEATKKRNENCPVALVNLKKNIVDSGLVDSVDKVTLPELMKIKKNMEEDLLKAMTLVQTEVKSFGTEKKSVLEDQNLS